MVRNYEKKKKVDNDLEVKIKTAVEEIKKWKMCQKSS